MIEDRRQHENRQNGERIIEPVLRHLLERFTVKWVPVAGAVLSTGNAIYGARCPNEERAARARHRRQLAKPIDLL
jgi:hypothetical protein